MTPEGKVRAPVLRWAKKHGVLHIRMHMGRGASAGWPDDLFIKDGRAVWIEFKRPGKAPTPLQTRRIEELRAAKAKAGWHDSADAAISELGYIFGLPIL